MIDYDLRTLHETPGYRVLRRRVGNNLIGLVIALALAATLISAAVTEAHLAGIDAPGLGAQCGLGLGCVLWAVWHITRLQSLLGDEP